MVFSHPVVERVHEADPTARLYQPISYPQVNLQSFFFFKRQGIVYYKKCNSLVAERITQDVAVNWTAVYIGHISASYKPSSSLDQGHVSLFINPTAVQTSYTSSFFSLAVSEHLETVSVCQDNLAVILVLLGGRGNEGGVDAEREGPKCFHLARRMTGWMELHNLSPSTVDSLHRIIPRDRP